MREETGVDVDVGRLLYVCDHLPGDGTHVVHVTFVCERLGGTVGDVVEGADSHPILGVEFVDSADLGGLGFTGRFAELVRASSPGAGSYAGAKASIGL